MPEEFISIREADEKAKEIGLIEKLSVLSKEQQNAFSEISSKISENKPSGGKMDDLLL